MSYFSTLHLSVYSLAPDFLKIRFAA